MDAYEGQTVRLTPPCPMCKGEMEQGFILDHGDGGTNHRSEWVAGFPQRSFWTGLKIKRARRYAVSTFRCDRCGFLAYYATTPLNDV